MPYFPPASSGGGYNTIQDEGTPLTQRTTIDFVGAGVTATDTGAKTQVSIPGGAAGGPTFGFSTVDFGAFPGSSYATVDVTGQTGFISTSKLLVWVDPLDEEDAIENVIVWGQYLSAGSFRVYARVEPYPQLLTINPNKSNRGGSSNANLAQQHKLFGTFQIAWMWVN